MDGGINNAKLFLKLQPELRFEVFSEPCILTCLLNFKLGKRYQRKSPDSNPTINITTIFNTDRIRHKERKNCLSKD